MNNSEGRIFFEEMSTLDQAYALGNDPRPLHLAFARLFDQAAQAISLAGSDLDEVLVERLLVVRRRDGESAVVVADFLADPARLKLSVLAGCRDAGLHVDHDGVDIVAVKLVARHDLPLF